MLSNCFCCMFDHEGTTSRTLLQLKSQNVRVEYGFLLQNMTIEESLLLVFTTKLGGQPGQLQKRGFLRSLHFQHHLIISSIYVRFDCTSGWFLHCQVALPHRIATSLARLIFPHGNKSTKNHQKPTIHSQFTPSEIWYSLQIFGGTSESPTAANASPISPSYLAGSWCSASWWGVEPILIHIGEPLITT